MSRILVTGGAGFIGSHLVAAQQRRGDEVRVLDNFCTGKRENLAAAQEGTKARVELIEGDLTDSAAVGRAVAGCELVFHEAALASVPLSVERPLDTHAACATGTLNVLDQARRAGVRRVGYAASSSAYGNQPTPQKKETDLPSMLSPYAAAKMTGELYCQAFWHSYSLETVALRYFNVFGPRQDPSSQYAAVVPLYVTAIAAGEPVTVFDDGGQSRDFTYVDNVVAANLRAAQAEGANGRIFNISAGRPTSVNELAETIGRLLGRDVERSYAPPRPGDLRDSWADVSEARRVLGFEPSVSLEDGLRRTIEHLVKGG